MTLLKGLIGATLAVFPLPIHDPARKPNNSTANNALPSDQGHTPLKALEVAPLLPVFENTTIECLPTTSQTQRKGVPAQPGELKISERRAHSVLITWTRPKDDGGCGDVSYIVQEQTPDDKERLWRTIYKYNAEAFKYIKPPQKFHLRVAAENDAGTSEFNTIWVDLKQAQDNPRGIFEKSEHDSKISFEELRVSNDGERGEGLGAELYYI